MPIEMMMKWIIAAIVCYGGTVALLYVGQRSLQYFPERRRTAPQAFGLREAEEAVLDTADGERLIVWHVPPREKQPIFLYFHGNGGSLRWRDERFRAPISDGSGLIALSYPVTAGRPDGRLRRAFWRTLLRPTRSPPPAILPNIVLWGESLGSAVAIALAADKPVGQIVLEAPFTSAADVGARHYRFVPVRLFMKDQFRSDLRVGGVTAPVLVVHGENDFVVPMTFGKRLYGLIRAPKRFVSIVDAGHNDLGTRAVAAAKEFIAEQ